MSDQPNHDSEPTTRRSFWWELPILVAVALVLALGIKTFLVQAFYIPSASMENTLQGGDPLSMLSTSAHPFDRILVDKLVYRFRSPARGEVIVFRRPPGWPQEANSHISTDPVLRLLEQVGSFIGLAPTRDSDFVKRVIGVGGDTISCQSDVLSVNGHVLHEPYLYPGSDPCSSDDFDNTTEVVPKGDLFVMGDHRDDSDDSRVYGPVPISDVIGRAIAVIWPIKDWQTLHIPSTFKQAGLAAASSPVTPMTALAATSATLIRRARRRRQSAVSIIRRGRQSNQSRP